MCFHAIFANFTLQGITAAFSVRVVKGKIMAEALLGTKNFVVMKFAALLAKIMYPKT